MMRSSLPYVALLLSSALTTVGCDKKDSAPQKPEGAAQPPTQGKPAPPKEDATAQKTSTKVPFVSMRSKDAHEGLKMHPRTVAPKRDWLAQLDENSPKEALRQGAPLPFTRLDAGRGFFCGTLKNGPVRCWGRRDDFVSGGFVDIAVAGDAVCAVSAQGGVTCLDEGAPSLSGIKRVAGSGKNFCALDKSGQVHCWARSGDALKPPPTLNARYIAVGISFACAGNQERELECWGRTKHLKLPEHLPVKDIASTDLGICVIKEDQTVQCFGQKSLNFGDDKFTAINGGFGTLCAKRDGVDETVCKGAVEETYKKPSQRVAVTTKTLCALTLDGTPDCQGTNFGPEVSIPRSKVNEPSQSEVPHFKEFVDLFPELKLPFDLTRKATFDVGVQPDEKFYHFLDNHPSAYRIIGKFTEPTLSVLVFEWRSGHIELYTYDKLGNIVRFRTVAALGGQAHFDEVPLGDGRTQENSSHFSTESTLGPDGKLETTKYQRQEIIYRGAKKIDNKRQISHIECVISGSHSIDQIQPDGTFKRLEAKVLPTHAETDKDGCGDTWPHLSGYK